MKKWKDFLIESQRILKEFNKDDEDEVMADEARFTIAYEIELVADEVEENDDYDYDMQTAMEETREDEARGFLSEDYFIEELEDTEVDRIFSDHPDDGEEMIDWYYNEIPDLSLNDRDVIITSIAYMGDDAAGLEEKFDSIFRSVYEKPWVFLRYLLKQGSSSRREIANMMGWEEEQLTFDWEEEGGKGYPPDIEVLVSPKIIKKLINYFIINLDQIGGPNLLPEARKNDSQINIRDFINDIGSKGLFDEFVDHANDVVQSVIDDIRSEITALLDDLSDNPKNYEVYWVGKIMAKYRMAVNDAADLHVKESFSDFERDPIQYLEDMGYEEYQYFDRDQWEEDYRDHNSSPGDCDTYTLTDRLRDYFPNFMSKYEDNLDFKEDESLTCGIEFTMDDPIYMTGLNNALEFLKIFFDEYESHNEEYFSMTEDTGLHTNIGYIIDEGERDGVPYVELAEDYNLFKALLFLNDTYATAGMGFPDREGGRWSQDVKQPAVDRIAAQIEELVKDAGPAGPMPFPDRKSSMVGTEKRGRSGLLKDLIDKNFDKISKDFSDIVASSAIRLGWKNVGFNTHHVGKKRYIEFRYPGEGGLTYEIMKKATLYYAFLVKAAVDPNFKKKEYEAGLVGFINNLEGKALTPISGFEFVRKMKRGDMFVKYDYQDSGYRTLRNVISRYLDTLDHEKLKNPSIRSSSEELATYISSGLKGQILGSNPRAPVVSAGAIFGKHFSDFMMMMYEGIDRKNKLVNYSALVTTMDSRSTGFEIIRKQVSLKSFERDLKNGTFITFKFAPEEGKNRSPFPAEEGETFHKIFKIAQTSKDPEQFYKSMVKLAKIREPVLYGTEGAGGAALSPDDKQFISDLVAGSEENIKNTQLATNSMPLNMRNSTTKLIDKAVAIRVKKGKKASQSSEADAEELNDLYEVREKFKKYNFQSH